MPHFELGSYGDVPSCWRTLLEVRLPKVPQGFRLELRGTARVVMCSTCYRPWRVPEQMAEQLSKNAWAVLSSHQRTHLPTPRLRPHVRDLLPRTGGYGDVG